jgi:RHS repeat-associated protein
VQVGAATNTYHCLSNTKTIDKNGYIYVHGSNESKTDFDVFLDDLNITHTKGKVLQEDHYYPFGLNISALSSTAPLSKPNRYKYNGMELNEEFDLDWYTPEFRSYDPQLGRFHQIDPVVKHHESLYAWNTNNPISFNDPLGSDSTQRANAVAQMEQHIDEGTTYTWKISASTAPNGNAPGVAGNCSSTVSNCVVTAGEPNPSNVTPSGDTGSGVLNIEGNTTSVNNSEVVAGNIVTFRMDGNYPYHTGLVTGVSTNDEGSTVITFGHNSSGNGAESDSFVLGSGESWDSNSPTFFKWDTTPDAQSNSSSSTTSQASSTSASRTNSPSRSVSSRISSTARNVRGQVASFLAEGRRRILGGG